MSEVELTRTLGIDLASQPKNTAACLIEWDRGGQGRLVDDVPKTLDDDALLGLMRDPSVSKIAIDAPLGWPLEFIDAVVSYRDAGRWPVDDPGRLVLRETDRAVRDATGQNPLSVTSSLIAWPSMRCARLLSTMASERGPVDRSGDGRVAEVYPAAALRAWSLSPATWEDDPGGYKGKEPGAVARRRRLARNLREAAEGSVVIGPAEEDRWAQSDDELDAFVCALLGRAVQLARTLPIPEELRDRARAEGWIHLPADTSLAASLQQR